MRGLGWALLAIGILVLVLGAVAPFSFADTHGWAGLGDILSGSVTILVIAAVPAVAGWPVPRIGSKAQ